MAGFRLAGRWTSSVPKLVFASMFVSVAEVARSRMAPFWLWHTKFEPAPVTSMAANEVEALTEPVMPLALTPPVLVYQDRIPFDSFHAQAVK